MAGLDPGARRAARPLLASSFGAEQSAAETEMVCRRSVKRPGSQRADARAAGIAGFEQGSDIDLEHVGDGREPGSPDALQAGFELPYVLGPGPNGRPKLTPRQAALQSQGADAAPNQQVQRIAASHARIPKPQFFIDHGEHALIYDNVVMSAVVCGYGPDWAEWKNPLKAAYPAGRWVDWPH